MINVMTCVLILKRDGQLLFRKKEQESNFRSVMKKRFYMKSTYNAKTGKFEYDHIGYPEKVQVIKGNKEAIYIAKYAYDLKNGTIDMVDIFQNMRISIISKLYTDEGSNKNDIKDVDELCIKAMKTKLIDCM